MRQKEEFQKEAKKTFSKKKCKTKNEKKKSKRGNFFPKQFNQVERGRNISWVNFQKKKVSKKKLFSDFSFLVKNI